MLGSNIGLYLAKWNMRRSNTAWLITGSREMSLWRVSWRSFLFVKSEKWREKKKEEKFTPSHKSYILHALASGAHPWPWGTPGTCPMSAEVLVVLGRTLPQQLPLHVHCRTPTSHVLGLNKHQTIKVAVYDHFGIGGCSVYWKLDNNINGCFMSSLYHFFF